MLSGDRIRESCLRAAHHRCDRQADEIELLRAALLGALREVRAAAARFRELGEHPHPGLWATEQQILAALAYRGGRPLLPPPPGPGPTPPPAPAVPAAPDARHA